MSMNLNTLHPAPGSRRDRRRIGRGHGSGRGKTGGKGTKGQKARTGASIPAYFEGGQNPLVHRMPVKRGLHNKGVHRPKPATVNLSQLARFAEGSTVGRDALVEARLMGKRDRKVKILGDGELTQPLIVEANQFSASARAKIEAAGGQAVVIGARAAPESAQEA
jgi:large subunit ribosomal protein L15